jgi:hypothetical protein
MQNRQAMMSSGGGDNQVDCGGAAVLARAGRKLLRRGGFTSREDLETRITAFIGPSGCGKRARPRQWSYDADAGHTR